jgi:hypothetical protein
MFFRMGLECSDSSDALGLMTLPDNARAPRFTYTGRTGGFYGGITVCPLISVSGCRKCHLKRSLAPVNPELVMVSFPCITRHDLLLSTLSPKTRKRVMSVLIR